jgi:H+/Na+-translocating ferredoxin:NAD+ oxidoreductase subunit G
MNGRRGEVLRIAWSMTLACLVGSAVLGAVYIGTDRYAEQARKEGERRAITDMLGLDSTARVVEIHQYLTDDGHAVVYRRIGTAATDGLELRFSLDGTLLDRAPLADVEASEAGLTPLGRVFVARQGGRPAGFVIEGDTRGYKNTIRFFVALDAGFDVAGVRVIAHEEDPGLGAEVATPWFQGQFVGRSAESLEGLGVTRDPMPEDWRAALDQLKHTAPAEWLRLHPALVEREHVLPIHAVSGATISSEALTRGVRTTVAHFRRRWSLIAPLLGEPS